MVTLAERVAELMAQRELVLPADHDRRGWYFGPEGDPSWRPASCAAQRTPYIAD
jgi:hypothetical protein